MRRRNSFHWAHVYIAVAIVAGSMATTLFVLSTLQPADTTDMVVATVTPEPIRKSVKSNERVYSLPKRLIIPKLKIDTNILPLGLTATGNMDAPATNKDTGWYEAGVRPGNEGSAVIDGHRGIYNEAVFGELDLLVEGDSILVVDDQGSSVSFVVRKIEAYDKDSDATDIFNSQKGSHLNLITCNGDWELKQATYSKRLVIFSDEVESKSI